MTSSSSATSVSSLSTRRAPPATRAPSARSARAIAAPMPLEAPVTIAVFPSSFMRPTLPRQLDQARRVLDLECRVRHLEALPQQLVDLTPDRMAVGSGCDEDVR